MYEIRYRVTGVPFVGIAYVAAESEEEAEATLTKMVECSSVVSVIRYASGIVIFAGCEDAQ